MIQSVIHRWPLLFPIFRAMDESRVEKTGHYLKRSTNRSNFLLLHKKTIHRSFLSFSLFCSSKFFLSSFWFSSALQYFCGSDLRFKNILNSSEGMAPGCFSCSLPPFLVDLCREPGKNEWSPKLVVSFFGIKIFDKVFIYFHVSVISVPLSCMSTKLATSVFSSFQT